MQVRQYMTADVVTANLRDGLHQTLSRMRERRVRHMPVLDDHGHLAGVISDRDIRRPDFVDPQPDQVRPFVLDNSSVVADAMSAMVTTIGPDDPIAATLGVFIERHYGAMPVVENGQVVGILSVVDVLRAFRDHLSK
jgi:acetoin utilization protein AcuB